MFPGGLSRSLLASTKRACRWANVTSPGVCTLLTAGLETRPSACSGVTVAIILTMEVLCRVKSQELGESIFVWGVVQASSRRGSRFANAQFGP